MSLISFIAWRYIVWLPTAPRGALGKDGGRRRLHVHFGGAVQHVRILADAGNASVDPGLAACARLPLRLAERAGCDVRLQVDQHALRKAGAQRMERRRHGTGHEQDVVPAQPHVREGDGAAVGLALSDRVSVMAIAVICRREPRRSVASRREIFIIQ